MENPFDFLSLGFDIHLEIISHLRVLDIINLMMTCKALEPISLYRAVWTKAFEDALHVQHIAPAAYQHILDHASLSTLKKYSTAPDRLTRKLCVTNVISPVSRTFVPDPDDHIIEAFCVSIDNRFLVTQSKPGSGDGPRYLSIWDTSQDDYHIPVLCHREALQPDVELIEQTGICRHRTGIWVVLKDPTEATTLKARKYSYNGGFRGEDTRDLQFADWAPVMLWSVYFAEDVVFISSGEPFGDDSELTVWDLDRGVHTSFQVVGPRGVPHAIHAFQRYCFAAIGNLCYMFHIPDIQDMSPLSNGEKPTISPIQEFSMGTTPKYCIPSTPVPPYMRSSFFIDLISNDTLRWTKLSIQGAPESETALDLKLTISGWASFVTHNKVTGVGRMACWPWGAGCIAQVHGHPWYIVLVEGGESDGKITSCARVDFHNAQTFSGEDAQSDMPGADSVIFSFVHGTAYDMNSDMRGIRVYQFLS